MDSITLDDIDVTIGSDTTSKEFLEFCSDLDELGVITDHELYFEKVEDKQLNLRNTLKAVNRNTKSTTVDVGAAYGNIVDGNSKLIKSVWDLTMRAINLSTRIIGFILGKLAHIPKAILIIGNKVGDIPSDIRNKIRGNIKLYITVNDIQNLYNKQLFKKVDTFMSLAVTLSQGETWGTFFNKRKSNGVLKMKENDMKTCRAMDKLYEEIKLLEFQPSTIEMQHKDTVNMYFGDAKSVKFVDLHGATHDSTYYEALTILMKDIEGMQGSLKKIQSDIGSKYSETQMNSSFSKLDFNAQNRISSTIQMMAKIINVIGNIVRYVKIDMKSIESATETLLKKQGIANTKNTSEFKK